MGLLQDKVAIITGATNGAGLSICAAFTKEGARVAIVDMDEFAATALATDLASAGAQAIAVPCDVRNGDDITRSVNIAVDWFGTVDILVNNAQFATHDVALADMSDADFDLAMVTGPTATFRFMRACHPHLVNGGHVINLRSGTDVVSMPNSAAREWGWYGISVNYLTTVVRNGKATANFDDHADELNGPPLGRSILRNGDADIGIGHVAVLLAGTEASVAASFTATTSERCALIG